MPTRTARDIMSRDLICVNDDLPVAELARLLTDKGISGAPVLDRRGQLVGVVSVTDIVSHELKVGHTVVTESEYYGRPDIISRSEMRQLGVHVEDYGDELVRDIMSPIVISSPATATVSELAERMGVNRVHRLLITDDDETVIGMVSALDLIGLIPGTIRRIRERSVGEVLWATDLGPDSQVVGERAVRLSLEVAARVVLLHVTPDLTSLMRAYGDRPELKDLQRGFEETALAHLQDLATKLLDDVTSYQIVGRSGDPAIVIAAEIRDRRPDYVVIGGRRPDERRLPGLGSVAERVLATSPVPVITVPPIPDK